MLFAHQINPILYHINKQQITDIKKKLKAQKVQI